jgi:hypothetical protein
VPLRAMSAWPSGLSGMLLKREAENESQEPLSLARLPTPCHLRGSPDRWASRRAQNSMSDGEIKIQRWERYIEECRREAKLLSAEGQRTMQTVIDSYQELIAMVREQDKRKS